MQILLTLYMYMYIYIYLYGTDPTGQQPIRSLYPSCSTKRVGFCTKIVVKSVGFDITFLILYLQ